MAKKHESIRHVPADYATLFWLFLIGSVMGVVLEGIWHILRKGFWETHVATVWGPFCIIYGLGAVAVYLVYRRADGASLLTQFCIFALAGSAVEYVSSVFQEYAFGTRSWDYSGQLLNVNGRISLRMTFLWGVVGVAASRLLFPGILRLFERWQLQRRRVLLTAASAFMAVNLLVTCAALGRWGSRMQHEPPQNPVEMLLDERWGDERLQQRFPNMHFLP